MPLVNHNLNNLAGGVSRQPEEARFDNQVEEMVNFEPYVTGSVRKRNPLKSIATVSTHTKNTVVHSYNRGDGLEKYIIKLNDNGFEIIDTSGVSKDVNLVGTVNPLTLWAGADWKKDISFLTVGDTTWVLNKKQVVAMSSDLSPTLKTSDRAFYWIKRSFDDGQDGGYDYTIKLDDSSFTTNNTSSDDAAADLVTQINTGLESTLTTSLLFSASENRATVIALPANTYNVTAVRVSTGGIFNSWGYSSIDNTVTVDITNISTDEIGTAIANTFDIDIDYESNTDFIAIASGSIVKIVKRDGSDFTFSSSDSWGDQASIGWKDSVSKIGDLPSSMDGFSTSDVGIVEITGTDRNEFTSYYLKWEDDRWAETMGGGLEYKLDSTTLPAKLVRVSDGSFSFGFNENYDNEGFTTDWENRLKGDDDSNPTPSFIGKTLSNMFFFRNRLGFTAEENVILSEVASYYNFFATTVIEVLDSDPIDVSVDSDTVTNIKNVNAVAGSLTLWGTGDAQFVLSGGEILSPTTTRVSKTSSYACDNSITPVVVDNEILFFNKLGANLDVMAYSASSLNTDTSSAESISTNVMGYLPSTITKAVVASASNLVFLLDSANSKILYVYKYHINKNEKILSSWFKWTFDYDIKDICVLENELYLFINDNNLAKIELSIKDLDSTFLDMGLTTYKSEVLLSKYNIETKQGSRIIREPFYLKNIKVSSEGVCDLEVVNEERNNVKLIKNKHIGRRLFIGGNSNKIRLGFVSEYGVGCLISTLSLEGIYKSRSKNV